jgi:hypothetical protein
LKIEKNTQIGFLEYVKEIYSDFFIYEVEKIEAKLKPPLQPNDRNEFLKDLKLNVPANEK